MDETFTKVKNDIFSQFTNNSIRSHGSKCEVYMERNLGNNKSLKNFHVNISGEISPKR